jgi:hypothetical protein
MTSLRVLATACLIGGIGAYLVLSGPVLLKLEDSDAVQEETLFILLNPLRDRGPEKAAERFLVKVKAGEVRQALVGVKVGSRALEVIELREAESRFDRWEIWDRTDSPRSVELDFALYSSTVPGLLRLATVTVAATPDSGAWSVVEYRTLY